MSDIYDAIIADTLEDANKIVDAINKILGYPNEETKTITYCEPCRHADMVRWIVLVPNDSDTYKNLGNIVKVDLSTDRYLPPPPWLTNQQ